MDERGAVRLDGPWGTREVPIAPSADPAAVAGSDFVLITVKSQDTELAAAAAAPHWGNAIIVSIQNGINDHRLAPFVEPGRLTMGMTATNMALVEPGHVSLQLGGATVLGPPVGRAATADMMASNAAAALLGRIRWPSLRFLAHPNALGVRYNKLAINALGYASCLSASNFITEDSRTVAGETRSGCPLCGSAPRVCPFGIALQRIPGIPNCRSSNGSCG